MTTAKQLVQCCRGALAAPAPERAVAAILGEVIASDPRSGPAVGQP